MKSLLCVLFVLGFSGHSLAGRCLDVFLKDPKLSGFRNRILKDRFKFLTKFIKEGVKKEYPSWKDGSLEVLRGQFETSKPHGKSIFITSKIILNYPKDRKYERSHNLELHTGIPDNQHVVFLDGEYRRISMSSRYSRLCKVSAYFSGLYSEEGESYAFRNKGSHYFPLWGTPEGRSGIALYYNRSLLGLKSYYFELLQNRNEGIPISFQKKKDDRGQRTPQINSSFKNARRG